MIRYLDLGRLCPLLKGVFRLHVTFVILKQNKTFILVFDISCGGKSFCFCHGSVQALFKGVNKLPCRKKGRLNYVVGLSLIVMKCMKLTCKLTQ